jgi:pilus assembly protein CpaC
LLALLFASGKAQDHESRTPELPIGQHLPASDATAPFESGPSAAPESLSLDVGKSTLIESSLPIDRISVGLGDFAVATAVSPYEVLLNGKVPGATSMIIWQEGGSKLLYDVTVHPSPLLADDRLEEIERQIKLELPAQEIHLTEEGGAVFLRGKVKDMTSADRALSIASTLGKTINLLYVDVPVAEPQILLRVKFASVDRNLSNQLGLNLFSTGAGNTIGGLTTGQSPAPTFSSAGPGQPASVTLSDALNLFLFRPDLNLGATIQALEVKGLLEVLSEPNVSLETVSRPASSPAENFLFLWFRDRPEEAQPQSQSNSRSSAFA